MAARPPPLLRLKNLSSRVTHGRCRHSARNDRACHCDERAPFSSEEAISNYVRADSVSLVDLVRLWPQAQRRDPQLTKWRLRLSRARGWRPKAGRLAVTGSVPLVDLARNDSGQMGCTRVVPGVFCQKPSALGKRRRWSQASLPDHFPHPHQIQAPLGSWRSGGSDRGVHGPPSRLRLPENCGTMEPGPAPPARPRPGRGECRQP